MPLFGPAESETPVGRPLAVLNRQLGQSQTQQKDLAEVQTGGHWRRERSGSGKQLSLSVDPVDPVWIMCGSCVEDEEKAEADTKGRPTEPGRGVPCALQSSELT